jgi:prepilin peptidase CpaA
MPLVLVLMLGGLLLAAGIEDARRRTIANGTNAAVALLAPAWWWANGLALWPDVAVQLGVAAGVFALFVGLFAIGQMGGGDVKLIGAAGGRCDHADRHGAGRWTHHRTDRRRTPLA